MNIRSKSNSLKVAAFQAPLGGCFWAPDDTTEFKNLGKVGDDRDTLYFNAFTEGMFSWDNDLKNDRERC